MNISRKNLRRLISGAYGPRPHLINNIGGPRPVDWGEVDDLVNQNFGRDLMFDGVGDLSAKQACVVHLALGGGARDREILAAMRRGEGWKVNEDYYWIAEEVL